MVGSFLRYIGLGSSAASSSALNESVRALPANWYTSEEMYQLERRAIFSRRWLILTHKSRLAKPGDFIRYNIANYDIVVSRIGLAGSIPPTTYADTVHIPLLRVMRAMQRYSPANITAGHMD